MSKLTRNNPTSKVKPESTCFTGRNLNRYPNTTCRIKSKTFRPGFEGLRPSSALTGSVGQACFPRPLLRFRTFRLLMGTIIHQCSRPGLGGRRGRRGRCPGRALVVGPARRSPAPPPRSRSAAGTAGTALLGITAPGIQLHQWQRRGGRPPGLRLGAALPETAGRRASPERCSAAPAAPGRSAPEGAGGRTAVKSHTPPVTYLNNSASSSF